MLCRTQELKLFLCCAASHVNARNSGLQQRPSLIICPQVLVGHWPFEMAKFVDTINLRALAYEGPPSQRHHLRASLSDYDVLVMSYETLRVDIDWVKAVSWNYCILDEGHIIRNPRSKTAQVLAPLPDLRGTGNLDAPVRVNHSKCRLSNKLLRSTGSY